MDRIDFLRNETVTGNNKQKRTVMPFYSVSDLPLSITERKAMALKKIFDNMPIFIGEKELIVGTRTFFAAAEGNEDGSDKFKFSLQNKIPYLNEKDIEFFTQDQSYMNKTHYTPDFSIVLDKGIGKIIDEAEKKLEEKSLSSLNKEFLSGVIIAYKALSNLILRYKAEALTLSENKEGEEKNELLMIADICENVSVNPPRNFHEAVQLFWFTHLGTIMESFEFINYGRLDVILGKYLKDTPTAVAQEIINCLILKMYDQTDVVTSYLGNYAAQLVVTLGGVLPNGENAVNEVTMMFLKGVERIRLPEPELNLRVSSKNPPEFLDKAAELTVNGCNFISYYNDDLFVKSLNQAGIPIEYAREYAFDLCQDINIPGKGDFFVLCSVPLLLELMGLLNEKRDYESFDELVKLFKNRVSESLKRNMNTVYKEEKQLQRYAKGELKEYRDAVINEGISLNRGGRSPMSPLPLLSALYHGCIENALDIAYQLLPLKDGGAYFGMATEAVNSLAAIKKVVFDEKRFTLKEVLNACDENFESEKGQIIRSALLSAPKWGNDDEYVDSIAVDVFEYSLKECKNYKTFGGGNLLSGIHQPHPVPEGKGIKATPDGRKAYTPIAVTLTPASGTMKNGPTAALTSASKIDPMLIQWNYCVMVNYLSSIFKNNGGKEVFKALLTGYFEKGGMQHQPHVVDAGILKEAQVSPEKHKDLIVRLWGVSAHFVTLPKELQDEIIARFE